MMISFIYVKNIMQSGWGRSVSFLTVIALFMFASQSQQMSMSAQGVVKYFLKSGYSKKKKKTEQLPVCCFIDKIGKNI